MADDETKTCRECQITKPLLDFPVRKDQPDGHHWWCLDCKRAKDREYGQRYRMRHPDQKRQNARRYARSSKGRARYSAAALMTKYRLTPEAFEAKLAAQDGQCPLCPPGETGDVNWHVDHDHTCCPGQATCGGCVRDILCQRHNAAMGFWQDDPKQLRAAADYIERHRSRIRAAGTTPRQRTGALRGEQHPSWKGDDILPGGLKLRMRRTLGKATSCANGCTAERYEWVPAQGADPLDPSSYFSLCRRCSIAYYGQDGAGHANARLTMEQAAEIRARYVPGQKPTQTELAREYGVSVATINLVVRGKRYVA